MNLFFFLKRDIGLVLFICRCSFFFFFFFLRGYFLHVHTTSPYHTHNLSSEIRARKKKHSGLNGTRTHCLFLCHYLLSFLKLYLYHFAVMSRLLIITTVSL